MLKSILLLIPLRNLIANKTTSIIVGSIIFFGTFLLVLGTSLVNSIDRSMAKSITSSITGDLQVFSEDSSDQLSFFGGGGFMGGSDLGKISHFGKVQHQLEKLTQVKAVIPMGIVSTTLSRGGNRIDQTIEDMRVAVEEKNKNHLNSLKGKLINIAQDLITARQKLLTISQDPKPIKESLIHLKKIQEPEFWSKLINKPGPIFEYLENNIAQLANTNRVQYFRNLGTDLTRFPELFDRFELVSGKMVPDFQRGYLISARMYEERLKHRIARQFDKIHKQRVLFNKTIADDSDLSSRAERLPRQYRRITYELTPENAAKLDRELGAFLPNLSGNLTEKLQNFLQLNDRNFDDRYQFFYQKIAPMLKLYWYNIGDTITLRAVTQSGYYKAINIPFYGTYRFKGLEEADITGAFNLIDLVSFRELYGVMTQGMQMELASIKNEVGIEDIEESHIEAELFGDNSNTEEVVVNQDFNEDLEPLEIQSNLSDSFSANEIQEGIAVSAAIILNEDENPIQAKAAINKVNAQEKLKLQTVTWKQASGIVGQLILVVRVVLYVAIFIIFLVALVIINNSMVMATSNRTPEIGTMRAIGAHRQFVMLIFVLEILILGMGSGLLGGSAAALLITYLGQVGLPAPADFFVFLFSGQRLYPSITFIQILACEAVILLFSLASTIYPARIATQVQPIVAMRGRE